MKCIILCGGKGMRMGGDVSPLPKPLVKVKDESLILHIIKIYLKYGVNDFILPLGYKGDLIKEYFVNLKWKINDFKLTMKNNVIEIYNDNLDFNIHFIDTGLNSQTGYRINQCRKLVNNEDFLLTYSDGLSDISIDKLINHHKKENKIVTVTGVNRESQFGVLDVENKLVTSFKEKEKS
ncbi:sugar phosphate nucleotidyltransferase [Providencia manganoxydans]